MNPDAVTYLPLASKPASFQRRVLLAVSGLTPQIVTETLYALAADEHAPFVPTEVHLITTAEGARRAELSLLSDDLGWFHKLCADYHLPGVKFDRSHIHIMRDAHGQPPSCGRLRWRGIQKKNDIQKVLRRITYSIYNNSHALHF